MGFAIIIYIFTALAFTFYLYLKWCHSYWERRGVPTPPSTELLFGNARPFIERKITHAEFIRKLYTEFKLKGLKHGGYYTYNLHNWLPVDYDLIKNILTGDFTYFMNHESNIDPVDENTRDPILLNLFSLTDEKWRRLRVKLTPTFTSGKLKMMFQTLLATTADLEEVLNSHAAVKDPVDIKDIVYRFTTDVISSCAFGLECQSLKNPSSEFRKYGNRIFNIRPTGLKRLLFIISMIVPKRISRLFRPKIIDQDVEDFFRSIVNDTVTYREKNNVFRKDFMHLLIQLKNRGKVVDDESLLKKSNEIIQPEQFLTMKEILAQCMVFFLAGFETSGTTIAFALYEMAQNENIQDKLRKEITDVLKKHDNQITYDSVMEMKYLDMIINETLRKHPPFPNTPRVCSKNYNIPGTDIVIERGVALTIPIFSIHHDPEYYPNPEKFDPERFTEENKAKRPPYTFLPFGEGPRICLGARFGLMQTKVGLISIIKNFKVTLNEKTKIPIKYMPGAIFLSVEGGIWLNVDKTQRYE